MVDMVESCISGTEACERYSKREPLRWKYLGQFREKWKFAELIFSEERPDKTSQVREYVIK